MSANSDKLNYSNDVYSIDVSQHQPHLNHHPKQNGIMNHHHIHQQPNDYYKDVYAAQQSQFDSDQADYATYPAMIGQEQNVDTGEIWDKRKESTSFEHEQPHSSSIMPR